MNNPRFAVITTTRNSAPVISHSMHSLHAQRYENWIHIIVNDASTDETSQVINEKLNASDTVKSKTFYFETEQRRYPLRNFWFAINETRLISDDDIIVTLDGDDELFDDSVLSQLAEIYSSDDEIECTCGGYRAVNSDPTYCENLNASAPIVDGRNMDHFITSHIRTFRAYLKNVVPEKYLTMYNNDWPERGGDFIFQLMVNQLSKSCKIIDFPAYKWNLTDKVEHAWDYQKFQFNPEGYKLTAYHRSWVKALNEGINARSPFDTSLDVKAPEIILGQKINTRYVLVIVVRNNETTIKDYLENISDCIGADEDVAMLIINDCSVDDTLSSLKQFASARNNIKILICSNSTYCGYARSKYQALSQMIINRDAVVIDATFHRNVSDKAIPIIKSLHDSGSRLTCEGITEIDFVFKRVDGFFIPSFDWFSIRSFILQDYLSIPIESFLKYGGAYQSWNPCMHDITDLVYLVKTYKGTIGKIHDKIMNINTLTPFQMQQYCYFSYDQAFGMANSMHI